MEGRDPSPWPTPDHSDLGLGRGLIISRMDNLLVNNEKLGCWLNRRVC